MERKISYKGTVSLTNSGYKEIALHQGNMEYSLTDVIFRALGDVPTGYKNKYCGEIKLEINLVPDEIRVNGEDGDKVLIMRDVI